DFHVTGVQTCALPILRLTATGPADGAGADADADLWVLVLAGPPRHADHDLLRSAPADRTLVVLGKADTHPDWDTAVAVARRWSEIGRASCRARGADAA